MLIADGHLDLAANALLRNRDVTRTLHEIDLQRELLTPIPIDDGAPGQASVCLPEMRDAEVFLALVSIHAPRGRSQGRGWAWKGAEAAYGVARGQLHYGRALEQRSEIRILRSAKDLECHLHDWSQGRDWAQGGASRIPIGVVFALEDPEVLHPFGNLDSWIGEGLAVVGVGSKSSEDQALWEAQRKLGFIVDLRRACAERRIESVLHLVQGPVVVTSEPLFEVPCGTASALTAEHVAKLAALGAVIGVPCRQSESAEDALNKMVERLDWICQVTGSTEYCVVGSNLDSVEPPPVDSPGKPTIGVLPRLESLLAERGYRREDISRILHGNWVQMLRRRWVGV